MEGVVGNVRPYKVFDVDLAIRKGYTPEELSLDRMANLHYSALPNALAILGSVTGDELYKSIPRSPLGLESWHRVHDLLEDLRCRPELPREVMILETHAKDWPIEETEHRRELYERAKKEISPEEWPRIEQRYAKLNDWGLFHERTSGMSALYIPFMRSNMVMPLLKSIPEPVIGEYMRSTGLPREALKPLRHLPYVDPWTLHYRDLIFELDFPDTSKLSDEEIKAGLRKVAERNLKFLLYHINPLLESIENKGVKGTLDEWNKLMDEGKKYRPHQI